MELNRTFYYDGRRDDQRGSTAPSCFNTFNLPVMPDRTTMQSPELAASAAEESVLRVRKQLLQLLAF
jgi:hypothetical protein